ncbi:zinc finger, CCHC-type containing protein [Tanacetum coccineum]
MTTRVNVSIMITPKTFWKCGKPGHLKKDCKGGKVGNKANGSGINGSVDGSTNSLKGQNMFNKSFQFYYVTYVSEAYFMQDDDVAWWVDSGAIVHVCKDRCWFKTYESLNDGSILHMENESTALVHGRGCVDLSDLYDLHATPSLGNKKYFVIFIDDASRFFYVYLLHTKDEALDKFKVFKNKVELQQESQMKRLRTDRGGEYMDTSYFQSVGLSQGFWGEAMAVVRLPDPKLKNLGERGIECIFVGYAKPSKAFRFYVIEPNESVSINSIIESRDAIFVENRSSSVPGPSQRSMINGTEDFGGSVVPEKVTKEVVQLLEPELRKSKRNRTLKNFRPEFQLYLFEGTMDDVSDQQSYCFNVEDDPKIFDEAMKSQDVAFWKEAINDEMDSIMGNNTWMLVDLPQGCKPLSCKWIFKRKLKVDGTIEKFKARLVIQGFRQKLGIDYFDTYASVARISTIRLLIAMASIHNLIIYQMYVKTTLFNGELDEEVYINQPQGFIMPGNENKVCKLIKSLYGLKQAPKQWYQKFDEVVIYLTKLTNVFMDEVSDQYSYCFNVEDDPKTFDKAMKSQDVALWKEAINNEMDFIMGNNTWVFADLPPGCKPLGCKPLGCKWIFKRKLKVDGTIEKFKARLVIQGFKQKSGIDYFDTYAPVARISTIRLLIVMASIYNLIIHQMDVKTTFLNGELDEEVYMNQPQGFIMSGNENKVCKLIKSLYGLKQAPKQWHQKFDEVVLSNGYLLNQADKCVYRKFDESVGKLSMYTSNPGTQHWQAIQRVLKYLKKIMDYSLIYIGYSSILEGYTDARWINNTKDNSSTSGWVFLFGGGEISWASKRQTCIIGSTMEYEFVTLATAGKEAEWLRNLIL